MWIRSQNGEVLMNANRICYVQSFSEKDGNYIVEDCGEGGYLLGSYSSEERAFKVLDMIQRQVELHDLAIQDYKNCIEFLSSLKDSDYRNNKAALNIFEMPKDEDVKV